MAKSGKGGGKKRCTRGKSCGSTCISRSKICIMETGEILAKSLKKASGRLSGKPPGDEVGHLPGASGKIKDGSSRFEIERLNKLREEGKAKIAQLSQLASRVSDAELSRREKDLARKFKEENGRWPNRKGERGKIRDKAFSDAIDYLRKYDEVLAKLRGGAPS